MPSICISTALVTSSICNMFGLGGDAQYSPGTCSSQARFLSYISTLNSGGAIRIMKGAVPLNFSEIATYSSRSADILIDVGPSFRYALNTSTTNANPVTITTYPITASASGLATWFWGYQRVYLTSGDSASQPNSFWGTVGLQGSGADLEISDTNIVSGNVYKVINLRISIPQSYTY